MKQRFLLTSYFFFFSGERKQLKKYTKLLIETHKNIKERLINLYDSQHNYEKFLGHFKFDLAL